MKQRSKMIKEFNVVIEQDEDGYFVASVPALRGCHTQATSLDVLMKRIKEAIELCLEVEKPVSKSERSGKRRDRGPRTVLPVSP
jgi:predicted RNase H-like HicB family nuclease